MYRVITVVDEIMNVWLIVTGERLPIDEGDSRPLRVGILADILVEKGNKVVLWSTTFNHARKKYRFNTDTTIQINDRFQIKLLHSFVPYSTNISVRRIINYKIIAQKFTRQLRLEPKPDVIVCAFPTIELSLAATEYGKESGIPVVVDVRDLWPDSFISVFPEKFRWLFKVFLYGHFKKTRRIFEECTAIIAVSDSYLQWSLSYANRIKRKNDAVFPLGYPEIVVSDIQIKAVASNLQNIGVDSSKVICWFIGTFGKSYDLLTVIKAARELERNNYRNVQFVFSGEGDNYANYLKSAEGLSNVIFTGWVDLAQIAYLKSVSGIGLAAYAKEAFQGLPNKIFEYMSAGLPILSSLRGETEQLLNSNQCGFTYEAGSVNDFLDKFLILVKDNNLKISMGVNSTRLIKTQYSAEIVYPKMVDLLYKLAAHNKN